MINYFKKTFILNLIVLILISFFNTSYANSYVENISGRDRSKVVDSADVLREEPGNIVGNLIVTGDSYGGFFSGYLKANYGYNLDKDRYCRAQCTIIENEEIYRLSLITQYDYVVLSIGVNDFLRQTNISKFANTLENFVYLAQEYDKKVFLHSFMSFPLEKEIGGRYKCVDYDYALKQVADAYDNCEYIDVMNISNNKDYLQEDNIHYNNKFYDLVYAKIQIAINKKTDESKVIITGS